MNQILLLFQNPQQKNILAIYDVVGKTIEEKDGQSTRPYKVTAVIKDIPHNSHLNLEFFFSMENVNYQWGNSYSHNFHTYLRCNLVQIIQDISKEFYCLYDKYVLPQAGPL